VADATLKSNQYAQLGDRNLGPVLHVLDLNT
jgi:hypothetical protein